MYKIDVKVERSMTLNTGNYQSIKPTVSFTIHDVPEVEVPVMYRKISELLDATMGLEILNLGNEMDTLKERGISEYIKILHNVSDKLNDFVDTFGKE
jgi:hypothetical protein